MAVLPIIYEAGSLIIRMLLAGNVITLSFYIYPFLTTKAPLSFVMFVAMALFIKVRKYLFMKKGKTLEEYEAFLKTNEYSWEFSLYSAFILLITCFLDLVLLIVFVTSYSSVSLSYLFPTNTVHAAAVTEAADADPDKPAIETDNGNVLHIASDDETESLTQMDAANNNISALSSEDTDGNSISAAMSDAPAKDQKYTETEDVLEETGIIVHATVFGIIKNAIINDSSKVTIAWGFGKHMQMIVLLPFLLLLSYTRVYENHKIDNMIPIIGAFLIIVVSIECLYNGIIIFTPRIFKLFS